MTKPKQKNRSNIRRDIRPTDLEKSPRVLIVTEGTVTEAEYFRLLAAEMGLGRKQVVIAAHPASSPMQVVGLAEIKLAQTGRFDYVYCVFDRDTHASYDEAVSLVERIAKDSRFKRKVEAITSVPCFEYWLYLHVSDSATSYSGVASPCRKLIDDLKTHPLFKNYSKKKGWMAANFEKLAANRDDAVKHSRKRLANAKRAGEKPHSEDPSTRIHIVVDDLKKLSEMEEG